VAVRVVWWSKEWDGPKARRKGAQRESRRSHIISHIAKIDAKNRKSRVALQIAEYLQIGLLLLLLLLSLFYYLFGSSALLTSRGSWIEIVDMCISFRVLV
jgi:hypothetical protein